MSVYCTLITFHSDNSFDQDNILYYVFAYLRQDSSPGHDHHQLSNVCYVRDCPQAVVHHDLFKVRVQHHYLLGGDE